MAKKVILTVPVPEGVKPEVLLAQLHRALLGVTPAGLSIRVLEESGESPTEAELAVHLGALPKPRLFSSGANQ